MSTSTVPLTVGGPPAPVQVTGNSPAGYTLINTDPAATITLTAGATGQAIAALEPGGSITWRDAAVFPYATATGAAGPVILVVTDQASDYSNPAAVAAVTAAKLAAQGIPSTMLDTDLGVFRIPSGGPTVAQATWTVGECSTVLVNLQWPQPAPQGYAVARLTFDDPAAPDFAPIVLTLTSNNQIEGGGGTWAVPVLAPRLRIDQVDTAASDLYASVVGNNRVPPHPDRPVQLGDADSYGSHSLYAPCPTGGVNVNLYAGNGYPGSYLGPPGATAGQYGSRLTRYNGACTLATFTSSSPGYLYMSYTSTKGTVVTLPIRIPASFGSLQFAHPSVPCWWAYGPDTGVAGNFLVAQIMQN